MAIRWAVASTNWGTASTWNDPGGGATVPGNGDTVYLNNKSVTLDQDITIGGANNYDVNAGSFIAGCRYKIKTAGDTSFVGIGAADNNVGTVFTATGVGSGTGVATTCASIMSGAWAPLGIGSGSSGYLAFYSGVRSVTCDFVNGSSYALYFMGSNAAHVVTVYGNIYAGTAGSARCVYSSSATGTLNIVGNLIVPAGSTGGGNNCVEVNGSTAFRMTLQGDMLVYGSGTCVYWTNSNASSLFNQQSGSIRGGIAAQFQNNTSPIFTCDVIEGNSAGTALSLVAPRGTVTITANTIRAGTADNCHGIKLDLSTTAPVTCNVTVTAIEAAQSGTPTGACSAIYVLGTDSTNKCTLNITATSITGPAVQHGTTVNTSSGVHVAAYTCLNVVADLYAGIGGYALEGTIYNNPANTMPIITGSLYDHANGQCALSLNRYKVNTTPTTQVRRVSVNGTSTTYSFLTSEVAGMPPVGKVQAGYVYAGGNLTGTAVLDASSITVPSANDVATAVQAKLMQQFAVLMARR